jgi:hypothetical protein
VVAIRPDASRHVAGVYCGRPFVAHAPRLLDPEDPVFRNFAARFAEISTRISSSDAVGMVDLALAVNQDNLRDAGCALAALAPLVQCRRLALTELTSANGTLTGDPHAGLRSELVWMDTPHPADSWFVAPLPERLKTLTTNLLMFCAERRVPTLMRSIVLLFRLPEIHPFRDGNGRTARAAFLARCVRAFGQRRPLVTFIDTMFGFRRQAVLAATTALYHGDWAEVLSVSASLLESATSAAADTGARSA